MDAELIGPYRLLEPLGQGGMGIVYRARHNISERAVALKTVKVTSAKWLESIRREIQALTRIRHPGIVRIIDHGVHLGRPWYAMDLLEGESLRSFGDRIWSAYRRGHQPISSTEELSPTADLETPPNDEPPNSDDMTEGPKSLPPACAGELTKVVAIFRRICATLAFFHGEGFVSCDLKPENILLVNGAPVLIDFGLATRHPSGLAREALEVLAHKAGTLPYMPPEQIRGELVDARSDLYSVGCMLYEFATGCTPFSGSPKSIITQHLETEPIHPAERVADLPAELSELILRFVKKAPSDRYGFAEEVAAELADLIGDVHHLPDFPPARPYLYRPRFVGRLELLTELGGFRDAARRGSGAMVLIGGESGVGKTRLAMEFMRTTLSLGPRVITSEASALSAERSEAVGAAPLHAVRPLLQAVADCCHEHGPEMTERLLGPRHAVLSFYEPLLANVPSDAPLAVIRPLAADAARGRLFKFLAETLARFAEVQPICWLLDDLGWADDLSMSFLQSLSAEFIESTPLLIVASYRSEETSPGVDRLLSAPNVKARTLARLDRAAVGEMAQDMLALRNLPDWFVDFITEKADGNPFFLAEYLRSAVNERFLYRDRNRVWRLPDSVLDSEHEALSLPVSLRDLLEHRLKRLSQHAQAVGLAAAVQGRETEIALLAEGTGLSDNSLASALDELAKGQVIEYPQSGRIRFAHDQLRAVMYAHAPKDTLQRLHAATATALESRSEAHADHSATWAVLGHHFAQAGQSERSLRYLRLAADHARSAYAHAEAAKLYQNAAVQARRVRLSFDTGADLHTVLTELCQSLGDMRAIVGERTEARAAYEEAFQSAPADDVLTRSRLLRKIGKTWETEHRDPEALKYYRMAQDRLGAAVPATQSERDEWIQTRLDQLWALYWLNDIAEMDRLVSELRQTLATNPTLSQRARFFQSQMQLNFRRGRYVVSEQTLEFARASLLDYQNDGNELELPLAQFGLGFALLLRGSIGDCTVELEKALQLAERCGDFSLQVRCLAYLALAARMRGETTELAQYNDRTETLAARMGVREYIAFAMANRAWLALRADMTDLALSEAQRAINVWRQLTLVFPFQWLALLPLLKCMLKVGNLQGAVDCIPPLLAQTQQLLPGVATDALTLAQRAWDSGSSEKTRILLNSAIAELEKTTYH